MSTIDDIDHGRELLLHGSQYRRVDDSKMISLARALDTPGLQICAYPVTPDIRLSSGETAAFLGHVRSSGWREDFDVNLQCLSEVDGEPLLTGWMSLEKFRGFLASCVMDTVDIHDPVRLAAARLHAAVGEWATLGAHDVCFEGYATNAKNKGATP
ncbi:MAG: hypothetical protein HKL99_07250 [Burkholderiales bacterium]|nr:hypothetical protein [Burkholderiales bacterium]